MMVVFIRCVYEVEKVKNLHLIQCVLRSNKQAGRRNKLRLHNHKKV